MHIPTFHQPAPVLYDQFGIGQVACAKIRARTAHDLMDDHASRAFRNLTAHFRIGSFDDKRRNVALKYLHVACAQYRQALAVMEGAR